MYFIFYFVLIKMWRKGIPFALLVGIRIGAATVENSIDIPQKLKMDLPFDPAIPLLVMYLKEHKILIRKNVRTRVHCSIIYNCQEMDTAQVSIST